MKSQIMKQNNTASTHQLILRHLADLMVLEKQQLEGFTNAIHTAVSKKSDLFRVLLLNPNVALSYGANRTLQLWASNYVGAAPRIFHDIRVKEIWGPRNQCDQCSRPNIPQAV